MLRDKALKLILDTATPVDSEGNTIDLPLSEPDDDVPSGEVVEGEVVEGEVLEGEVVAGQVVSDDS